MSGSSEIRHHAPCDKGRTHAGLEVQLCARFDHRFDLDLVQRAALDGILDAAGAMVVRRRAVQHALVELDTCPGARRVHGYVRGAVSTHPYCRMPLLCAVAVSLHAAPWTSK